MSYSFFDHYTVENYTLYTIKPDQLKYCKDCSEDNKNYFCNECIDDQGIIFVN